MIAKVRLAEKHLTQMRARLNEIDAKINDPSVARSEVPAGGVYYKVSIDVLQGRLGTLRAMVERYEEMQKWA